MRLKKHLITANIPGLGWWGGSLGGLGGLWGLGLEEIDRTYVLDSSNERSWCNDLGYV